MSFKRDHATFTEVDSSSMAQPAGPFIHPSRVQEPKAKKPKVKKEITVAKKRYLAKKARRHKVLAKAKKASTPKNKERNQDAVSQASDESQSEDDEDEDVGPSSAQQNGNAEAGPSRLPAPPTTKQKEVDVDTSEAIVDEAAEREKRKQEKREKRANRDKSEKKKKRKEEKEKVNSKGKERMEQVSVTAPEDERPRLAKPEDDVAMGSERDEQDQQDEPQVDNMDQEDKQGDAPTSPLPLEAFPLPTPAPAPDPALLMRQGLPANLENATFIDEDLKLPIGDLEVRYSGRTEKGLGKMEKRLKDMGVNELFAVQAAMLPHLMSLPLITLPGEELDDYLISAPTGSGKTLAYAIPIINILSSRRVTRLRAMIVLPTRDLVVQVRETMEALARGTGLTIGSVTGQHSFTHEQNMLIADQKEKLLGGSSKIDILIATPGRLMDHIEKTPNFTLQHLRFLVIDEADRLLNQSFQDWLSSVLSHTRPPTAPIELPEGFVRKPWDCIASNWHVAYGLAKGDKPWDLPPTSICQKLLFSATLTRNPAAIASLHLRKPHYFIVQSSTSQPNSADFGETFALPATLIERYIVVPPAYKPLHLIHLLHHSDYKVRNGLVFTKSVENVGRLVSLLNTFEEAYSSASDRVIVKGYTSEIKPGERKAILADFASGKVHLLVCSDVIARGMDLPTVENVVSYDTPVDMRKYVHRVGRTARAGRAGTAWTLVEKQEALHFKNMLKAAQHDKQVKKIRAKEDDMAPYKEAYDITLSKVKKLYSRHA